MNAQPRPDESLPVDQVIHGDALEVLQGLPENSVDSLVIDPPSSIRFMGKTWDTDKGGRMQWVAWLSAIMAEALRVVKPGGHAFVWALPRTSHWTACAVEDAGWEIKSKMYHLFSTGFPKSHNISKAIDAQLKKKARGGQNVQDQGYSAERHPGQGRRARRSGEIRRRDWPFSFNGV